MEKKTNEDQNFYGTALDDQIIRHRLRSLSEARSNRQSELLNQGEILSKNGVAQHDISLVQMMRINVDHYADHLRKPSTSIIDRGLQELSQTHYSHQDLSIFA